MANLYTAPRNRTIRYTPRVTKAMWYSPSKSRAAQLGNYLLATGKRLISDNVPILNKVLFSQPSQFILPGVQSVKWTYARDISEQYGLQRYTLLPWYTKAVVVTVSGKYYIGSFAKDTVVQTVSNTVAAIPSLSSLVNMALLKWIREELQSLDAKILSGKYSSNSTSEDEDQTLLSSLSIGDVGDYDSMSLFGFIKKFTVSESVDSPFVQAYDLEYIGIDREWYNANRASDMVNTDGIV